jgi:transcriptional regulator with XRE-family HTH domain
VDYGSFFTHLQYLFEKFFMLIGERLKSERERLGYSQTEFATLCAATRKTLFNWESEAASPSAAALAALALVGLDVLYVVTGQRDYTPAQALTAQEQTMLDYFRQASSEVRRAALGALLGASAVRSGAVQTVAGNVLGDIVARDKITKGQA